ncbi:MAG: hypothetical protein AAFP90_14730 [Planctomycetota bacterium]
MICFPLAAVPCAAEEPAGVMLKEGFENGVKRWTILDPKTWRLSQHDANHTLEITARKSEYKPPHRSPGHIALVRGLQLESFDITFKVRSTKDTGNHRDCCIFFGYQDNRHFYYAHLGAKPDPASGQIMIVNEADRTPLTKNERKVPWTDGWHTVRLVRDYKTGKIDVYFDNMEKPQMSTVDKTFGAGSIGIGSFDDMNEFDEIVIRKQ